MVFNLFYIDNNPDDRYIMEYTCTYYKIGVDVFCFANYEDFILFLKQQSVNKLKQIQQSPGCLILGVTSLYSNNSALLLKDLFSENPYINSLPFFILSSVYDENEKIESKELGFVNYFHKPYHLSQLVEVVNSIKSHVLSKTNLTPPNI